MQLNERYSIDKVFHFFYPHFAFDRKKFIIKSKMIKTKYEIAKNKLQFNKFSKIEGWSRTNFFTEKFRWSYYKPLLIYNNKVIAWILFDLNNCQAIAYININEAFCFQHNIQPPQIKINETNYIPIDYDYEFEDILVTFEKSLNFLKIEYEKMVYKFHQINCNKKNKYTTSHSVLEFNHELKDCNIHSLNLNACREQIKATYNSTNLTVYFNPFRKGFKHQFKIYEKTPTLTRMEYTFFKIPELDTKEDYILLFNELMRETIKQYNLKTFFDKPITEYKETEKYQLWFTYAKAGSKKFNENEFDHLLANNSYVFNKSTQSFKLRLIRMKLIKMESRGIYIPTKKLIEIKHELKNYINNFFIFNSYELQIDENIKRLIRGGEIDEI